MSVQKQNEKEKDEKETPSDQRNTLRVWRLDELQRLWHVAILSDQSSGSQVRHLLDALTAKLAAPIVVVGGHAAGDWPTGPSERVDDAKADAWVAHYLKTKHDLAWKLNAEAKKQLEYEQALQSFAALERVIFLQEQLKNQNDTEKWSVEELTRRQQVEELAEAAAKAVRTDHTTKWYNGVRTQARIQNTNTVVVGESKLPTKGTNNNEWSNFVQNARHYLTNLVTVSSKIDLRWAADIVFIDPNHNIDEWMDTDALFTKQEWNEIVSTAKAEKKWIVRQIRSTSHDRIATFPQ